MPDKKEDFQTMVRYWQYAFDEWFLTQELNPYILKPLWTGYYKRAIAVTANNAPMLVALFEAFKACETPTDRKFLQVVLGLASEDTKKLAFELAEKTGVQLPKT